MNNMNKEKELLELGNTSTKAVSVKIEAVPFVNKRIKNEEYILWHVQMDWLQELEKNLNGYLTVERSWYQNKTNVDFVRDLKKQITEKVKATPLTDNWYKQIEENVLPI